jgi:hypothetical protein
MLATQAYRVVCGPAAGAQARTVHYTGAAATVEMPDCR